VKLLFFLAMFGHGYQRSIFFSFLAFSAKDTNGENFGWSWSFLVKDTNSESFCFFLVIFGQGYQR